MYSTVKIMRHKASNPEMSLVTYSMFLKCLKCCSYQLPITRMLQLIRIVSITISKTELHCCMVTSAASPLAN